jgi:hypothetical protein
MVYKIRTNSGDPSKLAVMVKGVALCGLEDAKVLQENG